MSQTILTWFIVYNKFKEEIYIVFFLFEDKIYQYRLMKRRNICIYREKGKMVECSDQKEVSYCLRAVTTGIAHITPYPPITITSGGRKVSSAHCSRGASFILGLARGGRCSRHANAVKGEADGHTALSTLEMTVQLSGHAPAFSTITTILGDDVDWSGLHSSLREDL
jgi:hypothetical protein